MDHNRGLPGSPSPQSTSSETSVLGIVSLVHGIVSGCSWFLFLIAAGLLAKAGNDSRNLNVMIGLLAFAGIFLNLAGVIIGLIGAFKSSNGKIFAIAGVFLNGLEITVIAGMIAFGLSLKHH